MRTRLSRRPSPKKKWLEGGPVDSGRFSSMACGGANCAARISSTVSSVRLLPVIIHILAKFFALMLKGVTNYFSERHLTSHLHPTDVNLSVGAPACGGADCASRPGIEGAVLSHVPKCEAPGPPIKSAIRASPSPWVAVIFQEVFHSMGTGEAGCVEQPLKRPKGRSQECLLDDCKSRAAGVDGDLRLCVPALARHPSPLLRPNRIPNLDGFMGAGHGKRSPRHVFASLARQPQP